MTRNTLRGTAGLVGITFLLGALVACAPPPKGTYKTPEEAVQALSGLIGTGDKAGWEELLGPDAMDIITSGDEVADREDGEKVKAMILEKVAFEDAEDGRKVAILGNDDWTFPIPLVQENGRWKFDAAAGREELQNRRVGRNELLTLATLHAYVDAQREYFGEGRDGNPPAYAQRLISQPGLRDGLYWEAAEGEPESPMGPLVAEASEAGYLAEGQEGPAPYHGYFYRILTGQGKSAPGGEKSYLDGKGLMTGGFAAVAWPAEHGESGVMTFQVSQRGMVFQKDLGPETGSLAAAITAYAPDETWEPTGD